MTGDGLLDVQQVDHGILQQISLTAAAGQLVALTGRSGSGKSTLCHLLGGLESPSSGRVLIAGRPAASTADWSVVAVLPQRVGLLGELSGADNLALPARALGRTADSAGHHDLLRRIDVDMLWSRPVGEGSIGEQQRVGVARALALGSQVLVLDEPTAHQDDEHAELVLAAILAGVASGSLVVTATHDPRVIARASRVLTLDAGRLAGD